MQEVSNPFQALNNIFLKPNGVFNALAKTNNWSWLPFFLVTGLSFVSVYMYFSFVDFDWYVEFMVAETMSDVSPAEQNAYRNAMNQTVALVGAGVMTFLGPIIVNAIFAVYLNAMTKRDESNTQGFTDWYGFIWWTQMPAILNALIALVIMLMSSNHEVLPTVLGPLSMAYLFSIDMGSAWFGILSSLRLDMIWSIYLMTVGISCWTSFDTKKSLIIAIAPMVIIYTLWAMFTAF